MKDVPEAGEVFDCHVALVEGVLYRVTVTVGDITLSRPWVFDGFRAYAGGTWTRRG
ncbi:hypothetical protein [Luteibacter yeojuensis]|uniref:Uncharacterized protein n=1 Tax=Luteibacter yeojuensis TaxID=345309 RepID=A0A7X5QVY2_9GAMM|nr:hypothetical protein [Luteibacter yeojuensis]NID16418.1 hypothetical protein [Luteibacter yeojuensis]